jgi:3-hydroxyisobutyrate dehydrogenase
MSKINEFEKLGFIGLGAMGKPMLSHLARKLPPESRIWVYDVVELMVDEACAEFPDRVLKGSSARDVATQVVGISYNVSIGALTSTGYDNDHGTRGLPCTFRIPRP